MGASALTSVTLEISDEPVLQLNMTHHLDGRAGFLTVRCSNVQVKDWSFERIDAPPVNEAILSEIHSFDFDGLRWFNFATPTMAIEFEADDVAVNLSEG